MEVSDEARQYLELHGMEAIDCLNDAMKRAVACQDDGEALRLVAILIEVEQLLIASHLGVPINPELLAGYSQRH